MQLLVSLLLVLPLGYSLCQLLAFSLLGHFQDRLLYWQLNLQGIFLYDTNLKVISYGIHMVFHGILQFLMVFYIWAGKVSSKFKIYILHFLMTLFIRKISKRQQFCTSTQSIFRCYRPCSNIFTIVFYIHEIIVINCNLLEINWCWN